MSLKPTPEIISPWRLTLPQAFALDAYCENGQSIGAAAKALGLTHGGARSAILHARQRICEKGEFLPQELTPAATALLWSSWRKRQWAETLAS